LFSKDLQDLAEALENLRRPIVKGRYRRGPRPSLISLASQVEAAHRCNLRPLPSSQPPAAPGRRMSPGTNTPRSWRLLIASIVAGDNSLLWVGRD
jgi:hypothetical protein